MPALNSKQHSRKSILMKFLMCYCYVVEFQIKEGDLLDQKKHKLLYFGVLDGNTEV